MNEEALKTLNSINDNLRRASHEIGRFYNLLLVREIYSPEERTDLLKSYKEKLDARHSAIEKLKALCSDKPSVAAELRNSRDQRMLAIDNSLEITRNWLEGFRKMHPILDSIAYDLYKSAYLKWPI